MNDANDGMSFTTTGEVKDKKNIKKKDMKSYKCKRQGTTQMSLTRRRRSRHQTRKVHIS